MPCFTWASIGSIQAPSAWNLLLLLLRGELCPWDRAGSDQHLAVHPHCQLLGNQKEKQQGIFIFGYEFEGRSTTRLIIGGGRGKKVCTG